MAMQPPEKTIEEIVTLLQKGDKSAWKYVSRSNISALVIEADSRKDQKLAQQLRDWF